MPCIGVFESGSFDFDLALGETEGFQGRQQDPCSNAGAR